MSDKSDISTWDYPDWNEPEKPAIVEEVVVEDVPKPPTAQELEEIRQQAWQEGFDQGKKQGFDEGHQSGHQQGYEEGKAQGVADGLEQGQQQGQQQSYDEHKEFVQQAVEQLISIVVSFEQPLAEQQHEISQALIHLVLKIAKGVVLRELQQDPKVIEDVVAAAINALPVDYEQARIYLNPQDIETIEHYLAAHHHQDFNLLADAELQPGGCRIQTSESLLDYSLSDRFLSQVQGLLQQANLASDDELANIGVKDDFAELIINPEIADSDDGEPDPTPVVDVELESQTELTDESEHIDVQPKLDEDPS